MAQVSMKIHISSKDKLVKNMFCNNNTLNLLTFTESVTSC